MAAEPGVRRAWNRKPPVSGSRAGSPDGDEDAAAERDAGPEAFRRLNSQGTYQNLLFRRFCFQYMPASEI